MFVTVAASDPCPTPDELAGFYDGGLPTDAHLRIGGHLRRCPACREKAASAGRPAPSPRTFPDPITPPPEPPSEPPVVLDTVGPYRIARLIGRGGMGAVYEAVHQRLGKAVALKILPRLAAVDPEAIARFAREVRAAGKLDHPNVVRATDAGEDRGIPYLVMELVDGLDLARLFRTHGGLPFAEAAAIGRQAADALAHAHEKGIVHRDVKPSNLMLTTAGVLKLLDLGLAVFVSVVGRADERITGQIVLGTQDYMAPEQWTHPADVTDRADVYGLGCVLYQALAGKPPFAGSSFAAAADLKRAHLHTPATDVRLARPDCPARFADLVAAMLAKPPEARPSAAEVSNVLAEMGSGFGRLAKLVEQTRLAPGTGFRDGKPTALAPPPESEAQATRPRIAADESTLPTLLPIPPVPPVVPPPVVEPPPRLPLGFIIFVLAVLGAALLGGLVLILKGFVP